MQRYKTGILRLLTPPRRLSWRTTILEHPTAVMGNDNDYYHYYKHHNTISKTIFELTYDTAAPPRTPCTLRIHTTPYLGHGQVFRVNCTRIYRLSISAAVSRKSKKRGKDDHTVLNAQDGNYEASNTSKAPRLRWSERAMQRCLEFA